MTSGCISPQSSGSGESAAATSAAGSWAASSPTRIWPARRSTASLTSAGGDPVLDGRPTFRLERYPLDRDSAYSRQLVWLDKQYQNPLRVEYYDRGGVLLKRATFQAYRAHRRWWRADAVVMENLQTRTKSIIRWEDRQLGLKLAPAGFDSARLED